LPLLLSFPCFGHKLQPFIIDYPMHDKTIVVTRCGRICLGRKKINFSTVFAGQAVASKKFRTTSGW
jgi:hypothetical protein